MGAVVVTADAVAGAAARSLEHAAGTMMRKAHIGTRWRRSIGASLQRSSEQVLSSGIGPTVCGDRPLMLLSRHAERDAWRRGRMVQARACKALYPGSIPGVASTR